MAEENSMNTLNMFLLNQHEKNMKSPKRANLTCEVSRGSDMFPTPEQISNETYDSYSQCLMVASSRASGSAKIVFSEGTKDLA